MQIANPQPAQLQEVFPQQRAVIVQRHQAQMVAMRFHLDLQHRRPTTQHRPAQAQQQALTIDHDAFDIEAVVLAGNLQERAEMRIVGQQVGELVVFGIALEAK